MVAMTGELLLSSKLFNFAVSGDADVSNPEKLVDGTSEFKTHVVGNLHHAAVVAALMAGSDPVKLVEGYAEYVFKVLAILNDMAKPD